MRQIRVLLAGMPRILMDMVKNIVVSQDDFTLAGEMIVRDGLVRAAADARSASSLTVSTTGPGDSTAVSIPATRAAAAPTATLTRHGSGIRVSGLRGGGTTVRSG